jgi:hypothetical protein
LAQLLLSYFQDCFKEGKRMDNRSNTKCKNTKLIVDAMRLADKMLVMAQNGVPECDDDSCMMIYGIIRDCGYKIRKTVEQEQFTDFAEI